MIMLAKRIISFAMALLMLMLTVPVMAFTALAEAADGGYTYSYTDIANRLIDPKYLSTAAEGERSLMFSSYGQKSVYNEETGEYENWNYNGDGSGSLRKVDDDGDGAADELLLAEAEGAGYISRIWSARPETGNLRIYIDGKVVYDMPYADYFNGVGFAYSKLSYGENDADAAAGHNLYVPITFNESFKVVAYEGWGQFYQINYTLMPEGVTVEPTASAFTAEQAARLQEINDFLASSIGTNPGGAADAAFEKFTVTPTAPAVKALTGKGAISGILVKINGYDSVPDNSELIVELLKELEINIYYDGALTPAVKAPLGDFFGSAYGFTPIRTLLMGVRQDRTLYNYYYMPYLNGARVEIVNLGDSDAEIELSVTAGALETDEEDMMYFYSRFTLGHYAEDENRDPDHVFLDVKGEGRFVGLSLHNYKKETYEMDRSIPGYNWWGEGDEKLFVDGEKFPSWYGTGTEDFFGYAWCRTALFTQAYHSQSYCTGGHHGQGNHVVSRSMMADSVPFTTSFEGVLEKYYKDTNYGYTAYYYLKNNTENMPEEESEGKSIDLYLIGGQSNAAGTTKISDAAAAYAYAPQLESGFSNVLYAGKPSLTSSYDLTWVNAKLGQGIGTDRIGPEAGMAVALSEYYNSETGKVAGILKYAHGGTKLSGNDKTSVGNWVSPSYAAAKGWTMGKDMTGAQYEEFLSVFEEKVKALAELGYTDINIKGMFWMQGESDRAENADYYDALRYLISDLRSDLSDIMITLSGTEDDGGAGDMNFFIGSISVTYNLDSADASVINKAFIETQKSIACETPNCYFIDNSEYRISKYNPGGTTAAIGTDVHHWGQADMLAIGETVGEDMLHFCGDSYLSYFRYDLESVFSEFIEGEALTDVKVTANGFSHQSNLNGYNWSGRTNLLYSNRTEGGAISFTLPAPKNGRYVIIGSFLTAKDFGIYNAAVNGVQIAEGLDFYTSALLCDKLTVVGEAELKKGYGNTMTFTNAGKNASSTRYTFAIDFLLVIPIEDYTSTEDIDLSRYTDVTRINAKANYFAEAESLTSNIVGGVSKQEKNILSGGAQLFWQNKTVGKTVTLTLGAPRAGSYTVYVSYMRAADFGIVQAAVNGMSLGSETDLFYTNAVDKNPVIVDNLTYLGVINLKEGYNNTISFTITGKNASSKGYYLGVDYILLIPAGESLDLTVYENAERTLTDETRKYEAEEFAVAKWSSSKAPITQSNKSDRSGGKELLYTSSKVDEYVTFNIPAGKNGRYAIYVSYIRSYDFGIFDVAVNGMTVKKSVDLFNTTEKVQEHAKLELIAVTELIAGYENTLTFTVAGKNASSGNHFLGIDYFVVVPAGDEGMCDDAETPVAEEVFYEETDLSTASVEGALRRTLWNTTDLNCLVSGNYRYYFWNPSKSGDTLTLNIASPSNGKYAVIASFLNAPDYGRFSASVNGALLNGEIDIYDGSGVTAQNLTVLGYADMTLGYANTLTFTALGKNTLSKNDIFGLDFVILVPVDEYNGTEGIDLSKYTSVSRVNAMANEFREAESLFAENISSDGANGRDTNASWSGKGNLWWRDKVGFKLNVIAPENGEYVLMAAFVKLSSCADWQFTMNGGNIGCVHVTSVQSGAADLNVVGQLTLKKGSNIVTLKNAGTNSSILGGLDFIILIPAEEYDADSFDPSVYTSRAVNSIVTPSHSYDNDFDADCNVCGEVREVAATEGVVGNVTWVFADGVLTISGKGKMPAFNYGEAPWAEFVDKITAVVIEEGVTSIGRTAFYGATALTSVDLPETLVRIDAYVFYGCTALDSITVPASVTEIGTYA